MDFADAPHDSIIDCDECHDGVTDRVAWCRSLDDAKCMVCHDGSPATAVETHHTPADMNCTDCHNVMRVYE